VRGDFLVDSFKGFWVEKEGKEVHQSMINRSVNDLPQNDVLIRVHYSSLNYKDALSAKGLPGVTRNYPHTPGIDAAGVVEKSNVANLQKGDEVIVTGFDLGMNTPGGFGQYVSVPADWVLKKPENMALRDSMIYGTAGLTAALCYKKLVSMKAAPEDGPVLVTGSTGGVGSVAVSLLASEGFEVIACTGKAEQEDYLKRIGATSVVSRQEFEEGDAAPMGKEKFGHVLDTVGGSILSNALKSLCYGGSAAICGLVASPKFEATVLPFILRNINLLGVDSVEISLDEKRNVWDQLANEWSLNNLELLASEISLEELAPEIDNIFSGKIVGRKVVCLK
jgi:acrylyl-CoA reductase (NADPH)